MERCTAPMTSQYDVRCSRCPASQVLTGEGIAACAPILGALLARQTTLALDMSAARHALWLPKLLHEPIGVSAGNRVHHLLTSLVGCLERSSACCCGRESGHLHVGTVQSHYRSCHTSFFAQQTAVNAYLCHCQRFYLLVHLFFLPTAPGLFSRR